MPMLRFAVPEDAGALLAIYAQYIDTSVTFEYALPTEAEFRARIEEITRTYPYLVCECGGRIEGYAYAHRCAERAAYQWGAKLSVYIDKSARSRGLGTALYTALMELLRLQGVRNVYGVVTQPNEPSDRLHISMGFSVAGVARRAGYKAGEWHDVATYERSIAPCDGPPSPLRGIRTLERARLDAVLRQFPGK